MVASNFFRFAERGFKKEQIDLIDYSFHTKYLSQTILTKDYECIECTMASYCDGNLKSC